MTSVVIAAHNEAAVIGNCLDAILADAQPGEFDITVVANGCTDDTARVARARPGVRVLDLPTPGKSMALNAGDAATRGFPRVYLDADIALTTADLRKLASAVSNPGPVLAAVPRRLLDLDRSSLLVRAFYTINARLPAYRDAIFGRGVIVLSERARGRFTTFPDIVADDLFLDSLFMSAEKAEVPLVAARVRAPRRTSDLVRRLARVRYGNAGLRATHVAPGGTGSVRRADRLAWLRSVVLPRPHLAPAAACYVAITLVAALQARLLQRRDSPAWGQDRSTRMGT